MTDLDQPDPPNLVLFVADALRLDYGREYLADFPGTFVEGIAQGNRTPMSFPTLVSGLGPNQHGRTEFQDPPLDEPTIFDLPELFPEYDVAFFDHPNDPVVPLLGSPPVGRLEDLEPPFIYVERELATHTPYGTNWHHQLDDGVDPFDAGVGMGDKDENARAYPDYSGGTDVDWLDGRDYIGLMWKDAVDFQEDYERGVQMAVDRFRHHLDYLKDQGWLDDTFVVFTADHGEVWGPHDDRPGYWIHNVDCPEVIDIPVLYYDREPDVDEPVLLKDVVRQWWPNWDLAVHEINVDEAADQHATDEEVEQRLRDLGYLE